MADTAQVASAAGSKDPRSVCTAVRSSGRSWNGWRPFRSATPATQGWTWEQIAQLLGVTRQAVHKKYASGRGPSGGRTDDVRAIHDRGPTGRGRRAAEARRLHARIGTGTCSWRCWPRGIATARPRPARAGASTRWRRYGVSSDTTLDADALTALYSTWTPSGRGGGDLRPRAPWGSRPQLDEAGPSPLQPPGEEGPGAGPARGDRAEVEEHRRWPPSLLGLIRRGAGRLAVKALHDRGVDATELRRDLDRS